MEEQFAQLREQKNVRAALSALRALYRTGTPEERQRLQAFVGQESPLLLGFLQSGDAKTRKNAALFLGDVGYEPALSALWEAYRAEQTLFVKSAYLEAMEGMEVSALLPELKERLAQISDVVPEEENKKHIEAEKRALRALVVSRGEIGHTFDAKQKDHRVLLLTNRAYRSVVARQTGGREHALGVLVQTDDLYGLLQIRTYRRLLFLLPVRGLLPADPVQAAQLLAEPMLSVCEKYHKEKTPFYFRVDCRSAMELKERSRFTKKLGAELFYRSSGRLVNSPTSYEAELFLYADKYGRLFPALAFSRLPDRRFSYRKHAIASSIHPSLAALLMELAAPYLKEGAQVLDPFCGVGTMLIERDIRVPARDKYGTDIFGDAVLGARENAALAGENIHFIHRDFFDFTHDYLFDEIVTNMPVRGKMTRAQMDALYGRFFEKAAPLLKRDAVIVMYTGEIGFVKKQLRLHPEFALMEEYCMQEKTGFYLLIIRMKG